MKMIAVKSSMIRTMGYDPETQTLAVTFKKGTTYHYADVPEEEYEGLLAAKSQGKYFWANIRTSYAYTKQE